jgi:hypothetical protein
MFIDICIGTVSLAFVVLVIYLAITLQKVIATLKQTKHILGHVDHITKTTSGAMDLVLKPLARLNKKKAQRHSQTITDVVQFAAEGIALYNQLKKRKR